MFKKLLSTGLYFQADPDAGSGGGAAGKTDKPATFEAWLETQPDEVKTLYQSHTTGLTTALEKEREAAKRAKASEKRLAELEAKEKEREDAAKSEMEKLTERSTVAEDRASKAEAALKAERVKNAVIAEASKTGFADPADAYTLIALSEIEIDETGKVSGAAEAIKKLAEAKPYLLSKNGKAKGDGVGTPRQQDRKREDNPTNNRVPLIRSL